MTLRAVPCVLQDSPVPRCWPHLVLAEEREKLSGVVPFVRTHVDHHRRERGADLRVLGRVAEPPVARAAAPQLCSELDGIGDARSSGHTCGSERMQENEFSSPSYAQCTGFDVFSHRTTTVCSHDPPGALRTRRRTPPAYP
eukprot:3448607-Prymnesium_polylepis.2